MTKKTLSLFIGLCSCLVALACGNEYYTATEIPYSGGKLMVGNLISSQRDSNFEYLEPYWSHGFGDNIKDRWNDLKTKIDPAGRKNVNRLTWTDLERAIEKKTDFKLLSDFAWYELRVGNKKLAVRLLEKLYELYPNEYNVLANLGTAYEVTGKNEKALEFLRKAVAINPGSHFGSEWIHIKILEQKVNPKPDYTLILGLDAVKDYNAWLSGKVYNTPITADSLMTQLAYQLHERIGFVRSPDAIVGQLVLDFGDLAAIAHDTATAAPFYEYAVYYHPPLSKTVNERRGIKVTEATQADIPEPAVVNKRKGNLPLYLAGGGLAIVLLFVFIWKRRTTT